MSEPSEFVSERETYQVLEKIGRGGQGVTWRVRESSTGTVRVLKEMRLEQIDDWKAVELFEREVEALSALDHPGIPKLLDRIVEDGRTAAIVQTYVEGDNLNQLMQRGPLERSKLVRALRECLDILDYLQRQVPPLIHRDINPKNIMMGERTFLIDFGAVRFGHATNLTSVGTFGYMAPEQVMGRPTPASDLFSLGMTFIALAARRDASEFPMNSASGQVDTASLLDRAGLDGSLRYVLERLTRPGTDDRFESPRAAIEALDAPVAKPRKAAKRARSDDRDQHRLSNDQDQYLLSNNQVPKIAMGIVLVLLVMGGAVAFIVLRSATPPEPDAPAAVKSTVHSEQSPPAPEPAPVTPVAPEPMVKREPPPKPPEVKPAPPVPIEVKELNDDNSAVLTLTSKPPAEVSIEGKPLGKTPMDIRRPFGKFAVSFTHDGRTITREVNLIENQPLSVQF